MENDSALSLIEMIRKHTLPGEGTEQITDDQPGEISHRENYWRFAVFLAGVSFMAVFVVSGAFIPRAAGPPSSSLDDVSAKSEWSFAGRDLLGWWTYENLGNPRIVPAPTGDVSINLKTPLDIPLNDYFGLEETTDLTLWKVNLDPATLERFRVRNTIGLVECMEGGTQRICPIGLFTTYGLEDPEPPAALFPVRFIDLSLGLVDSRLLDPAMLIEETPNG